MLKTKRLTLRELDIEDVNPLFNALTQPFQPAIKKFVNTAGLSNFQDFAKTLCKKKPGIITFGILNNLTDSPIGSVSIYETLDSLKCTLIPERTYSFGVWINSREQGKGYAKEAVHAAITDFFKNYPNLNFIQGGCFATNQGCILLMKSLGFHLVGNRIYEGENFIDFVKHRDPDFDYKNKLTPNRSDEKRNEKSLAPSI